MCIVINQTTQQMMTKESLHFSLADDFGITITKIAQEHLLYSLDVDKALKTITQSLIGCPEDLAIQIIKGDMIIAVDNDSVLVGEREPYHDGIYPVMNLKEWYRIKLREHIRIIDSYLGYINNNYLGENKIKIAISRFSVVNAIVNESKSELMQDIEEQLNFGDVKDIIGGIKEFIDESFKLKTVVAWINKTYPDEMINCDENDDLFAEFDSRLIVLSEQYKSMVSGKFEPVEYVSKNDALDNYLKANKEIDQVIDQGIKPVDILKNYTAGWLSPTGEYYALNGEIVNMLHNQIADALQELGIIPKTKEAELKVNPDSWLEQNGWVKIHGDNIQFAGCLNSKFNKKNVNMTDVQVKKIYEYIQICHRGLMRLGWKLQRVSAARFQMFAEDNMEQINKDYFEF